MWAQLQRQSTGVGFRYYDLISRLRPVEASTILATCADSVGYFSRRPIQDMKTRNHQNHFNASFEHGYQSMGILADVSRPSVERLDVLGRILYQVRNNLAHGSKGGYGDDDDILGNALPPMRKLLEITLQESKRRLSTSP